MTSVFDFLPPTDQSGAPFFTHKNIGDSIEGTYIGRTDGVMNNYGNLQTIVFLGNVKAKRVNEMGMPLPPMDSDPHDGGFAKVGISSNKALMLKELDSCNFGDIIGFLFTALGQPRPGLHQSKIIRIAHKEGLVDEKWLAEQKRLKDEASQQFLATPQPVASPAPTAAPITPAPTVDLAAQLNLPFLTDADKITHISNLMANKFGILTSDQLKDKVLETTGLAFLPMNLDLILQRLQ